MPQMLAVVGLLFGLLTGFLAADIGEHNAQAARAVGAETNALHEVRTLSVAAASDMSGIRQALHEFVRSEIQDEWPRMADSGRSNSPRRRSVCGRRACDQCQRRLHRGAARVGWLPFRQ